MQSGYFNCYKDRPWGYLESEEYIEHYGTSPVWSNYRRNQKGGIPSQKTRNTCIVGVTAVVLYIILTNLPSKYTSAVFNQDLSDHKLFNVMFGKQWTIVFLQNVKLLQIFIRPYTGVVYDPTRTVSIFPGLLPFQVPHVDFSGEDYSNSHYAVGSAPPPPTMTPWYRWYHTIQPETEVAQVKKSNEAHLT
ncbi:small ribosomal subunit protein mS40-like [Oncorhynchus nerka]|uniref:small ribosomal subunit protein mS40-like n=1 Tax=Oncorhynchus nerka TaxID=8023 RepID=UPI0031B81620